MGLLLQKNTDPRSPLDRIRRIDLERYAAKNGIDQIKPGMPAVLMRRILKDMGVTDIDAPKEVLGKNSHASQAAIPAETEADYTINADDALMAQWESGTMKPPSIDDMIDGMKIWELRAACKANGVEIKQKDKGETMREKLKAKLNGENAT